MSLGNFHKSPLVQRFAFGGALVAIVATASVAQEAGSAPAPKQESPATKTEAPKAEAPKAEAPKAEAPKAEAPQGAVQANPGAKAAADVQKLFGDSKAVITGDAQTFGAKSEPAAIAVIDNYLKAIGGKGMLAAIVDRKAKFSNIKFSATGQTEAEIALFMQKDHKYREEWEIKGFEIKDEPLAFIQIYNGELQEGWVSMLGTVSALEGRTLSVFVWDKYLDDFFAQWDRNGYSLRKVGEGLVDDDVCEIVECRDFTGRRKIRYFFSQESGLLKKKEWFDTTGKTTVKKEQFYKQYRRLKFADGSGHAIQFPLQLDIHVDGELDTRREYTEVAYNSKLSSKLFDKPEGVPFAPEITSSKKGVTGGAAAATSKTGSAGKVGPHGTGKSRRPQGSQTRGSRRSPTGTEKPIKIEPKVDPESAP